MFKKTENSALRTKRSKTLYYFLKGMRFMRNTVICTVSIVPMAASAANNLTLPAPLTTNAGNKVTTPAKWQKTRRLEILEMFRTHVYGRTPIGRPDNLRFEVKEINKKAMGGKATLKRINIHFSGPGGKGVIKLVLFIPNNAPKPVPGFLLICHRAPNNIDPTRKKKSSFWPAERIVERGYVAAAFHSSDLDPDKFDGFKDGVHGIFDPKNSKRSPDAWGTIAAWAWGASRVMDYFENDMDINEKHIGVVGHSRGGKASLWCGAEDERFALTISNDSGCSGAALSRNKKGERVKKINTSFPHWFCANYKKFNDKEEKLPIDQHELIALMAPRLVYVASASLDKWSDPAGEFLSCVNAGPVYQLYGLQGVGATEMPKYQQPLRTGHIGHHIRIGSHNMTKYDWNCYIDFADRHWKNGQRNTIVCTENKKRAITRDYWIQHTSGLSGLKNKIAKKVKPSGSDKLPSFEAVDWETGKKKNDFSNNYAQRIYGFILPERTGEYVFFIASDDLGELKLSTDENPENVKKIAFTSSYTCPRQWRKRGSQKSRKIKLEAGEKYYIEAIMIEGGGGDNLAVGWLIPWSDKITVIPGKNLMPAK